MLPEGHMDLSEFILRIGEHALPPSKIQYSVEHYCTYRCKQSDSSVHLLLSTVHNICANFNKTFSNLSIGKYDCRRSIYRSNGRTLMVLTHLFEQIHCSKKNSINFFIGVELKLFIYQFLTQRLSIRCLLLYL